MQKREAEKEQVEKEKEWKKKVKIELQKRKKKSTSELSLLSEYQGDRSQEIGSGVGLSLESSKGRAPEEFEADVVRNTPTPRRRAQTRPPPSRPSTAPPREPACSPRPTRPQSSRSPSRRPRRGRGRLGPERQLAAAPQDDGTDLGLADCDTESTAPPALTIRVSPIDDGPTSVAADFPSSKRSTGEKEMRSAPPRGRETVRLLWLPLLAAALPSERFFRDGGGGATSSVAAAARRTTR